MVIRAEESAGEGVPENVGIDSNAAVSAYAALRQDRHVDKAEVIQVLSEGSEQAVQGIAAGRNATSGREIGVPGLGVFAEAPQVVTFMVYHYQRINHCMPL
ncbi:MAG: hypothetical protein U5L09_19320 [Bacteroidales bacterium]|nr:hypothetical protein [Bacteroidales bacterium]